MKLTPYRVACAKLPSPLRAAVVADVHADFSLPILPLLRQAYSRSPGRRRRNSACRSAGSFSPSRPPSRRSSDSTCRYQRSCRSCCTWFQIDWRRRRCRSLPCRLPPCRRTDRFSLCFLAWLNQFQHTRKPGKCQGGNPKSEPPKRFAFLVEGSVADLARI